MTLSNPAVSLWSGRQHFRDPATERKEHLVSYIQQYGGSSGARGTSRQVGRALANVGDHTSVAIARVEACADIQATKIDTMSAVTQRGLQGAAFISQVEQQLAQVVPMSASRLQAIGDIGTLGLAQVVMDTATKLRGI